MRISYLVHGFPPRENTGTEQHTAALVAHMRQRGHQVQVIAATRAPGRRHAEVLNSTKDCHHIVNNIPARPLERLECDGNIRDKIQKLTASFKPDIVHIQHIQFLSADISFTAPTVFTFHDSWTWCAAGGLELRWPERNNCQDPSPQDCANCSALWHPQLSLNAHRLIGFAERLQPIIATEALHRLWQKLPNRLRIPLATERGVPPPPARHAEARNVQLKKLVNGCDLRISPSRFLAERAVANGIDQTKLLPHGIDERFPHSGGKGILFLGTLSYHKGVDLVAQAIKQAFPNNSIESHFYGFPVDPQLALAVNAKAPLDRDSVWEALQNADVLVMGSRWRENAPLVILEARAAGCPIIAPRIGGIPELIEDGVDGFLYEPGSIEACSEALQRWKKAPKLSPNPPPTAQARVDKLEQWYKELIE